MQQYVVMIVRKCKCVYSVVMCVFLKEVLKFSSKKNVQKPSINSGEVIPSAISFSFTAPDQRQ